MAKKNANLDKLVAGGVLVKATDGTYHRVGTSLNADQLKALEKMDAADIDALVRIGKGTSAAGGTHAMFA